jgi:hypothetical protein
MLLPTWNAVHPVHPAQDCPEIVTAFVDPNHGTDPANPDEFNLPAQVEAGDPFRTIQLAIDACQLRVIEVYNDTNVPNHLEAQGVVVCLPGTYGPTGVQAGPKDALPIVIRDRVSLRGQGARRTLLRGGSTPSEDVFWPDSPTCGSTRTSEVLIDFRFAWTDQGYLPSPWTDNSEEFVDNFTFLGGDVQVLFGGEGEQLGRVSNCLFDMRHDPTGVPGPYFGIEIVHGYHSGTGGYSLHPVNVLNNTFILGEECPAGVTPLFARSEAVAIIDVNNPFCGVDPDPDPTLRGLGSPSIQNNLIRDLPSQTSQKVLLGIDKLDVKVSVGTSVGRTNSFRETRAGSTNGTFWSLLLDDPPRARVNLDTLQNDPPFVGELLASSLPLFPTYRDWRLLPGAIVGSVVRIPQENQGSSPASFGGPVVLEASNGTTYFEPSCAELSSFQYDGEGYGNPRIVGDVDIGFDECHMMVMAGTWANVSNSHNLPDLGIDPNLGTGTGRRIILLSRQLVGDQVTIHGTKVAYSTTPWIVQPGVLDPPTINLGLPAFYRSQYISFLNDPPTNPTMPWTGVIALSTLVNPVSGLSYGVGYRIVVDNETGPGTFFNTQAVVVSGGTTHFGNVQSEYR